MKAPFGFIHFKATVFVAVVLWPALASQAAQTPAGTPGKGAGAAAGAATARGEGPVTQALFVNPRGPQEGRDPFFPRSNRPYAEFTPVTKISQPVVNADLRLGGISGAAEHRLAIINNRTFEAGEEGDVPSGSDRVRIRCLEIKADSVIIQLVAGGLRRELHFRRGL